MEEWVADAPEDLDVLVAQRDFEGAVDLVIKGGGVVWCGVVWCGVV